MVTRWTPARFDSQALERSTVIRTVISVSGCQYRANTAMQPCLHPISVNIYREGKSINNGGEYTPTSCLFTWPNYQLIIFSVVNIFTDIVILIGTEINIALTQKEYFYGCDFGICSLHVHRESNGFIRCYNKSNVVSRVRGSVTNKRVFWIGWLDLLTPSFTISLIHNQL
jgi:hypothetical protein